MFLPLIPRKLYLILVKLFPDLGSSLSQYERKKRNPSEIHYGLNDSAEIRSDLNIVLKDGISLVLGLKLGVPETADFAQTVEGCVTDGANHLTEMCGVQLNESVINLTVQSPSVAFWNFYHNWVSVFMEQSDL